MPATSWNIGISGSWFAAPNWSSGIPGFATDVLIQVPGTYTISLAALGNASSITMAASGATLLEAPGGSLNMAAGISLTAGTLVMNGANTIFGGITQTGGLLELGNDGGLGANTYNLNGGELLGIRNVTFTNTLAMKGNPVIAAVHGTTLAENSTGINFDATTPGGLVFGEGDNDGTIIWHTNSGVITNPAGFTGVEIAKGTFKGGDAAWGFIFQNHSKIDAGATLDMGGFAGLLTNLTGGGTITDSGAAANLVIASGGLFSGTITGPVHPEITSGALTLTGANTYSGGTLIDLTGTLQLGSGGAGGTVNGAITDSGALIFDHPGTFDTSNAITGSGSVTYEGGATYIIHGDQLNSGGTNVLGGTVLTNSGGALGSGIATLNNAELVALTSYSIGASRLIITGSSTVAAAHGQTVTIPGPWTIDATSSPATLIIGDTTNDGTLVWDTPAGSVMTNFPQIHLRIRAGTLVNGDGGLSFMTGTAADVTIDAGATLDMNGVGGPIRGLQGAGSLTSHGASTLNINGGNFAGVISGTEPIAISNSVFLTGANTYSGGTTIGPSAVLSLGNGGTTGSVVGDITDSGNLYYDRSDAIALTVAVSGTGKLTQAGSGTLTINRAETYSGGTNVLNGTLSIGEADAIGSGALGVAGGAFLTTSTMSLANGLSMSGSDTIAASTGTTLTLNTGATGWLIDATEHASITFGDAGHAGTIVWDTPVGSAIIDAGNDSVAVNGGTLKAGDSAFSFLLQTCSGVTVAAGAKIDIAGFNTTVANLQGSGQVNNSGAAAMLRLVNGSFAGQINGPISPEILSGTVTLTGGGSYTGVIQIDNATTLNLADQTARTVTFASAGNLNVINGAGAFEAIGVHFAGGGGDAITGGTGNETFDIFSGGGSNSLNGGGGFDTAVFAGNIASYTVNRSGGVVTVSGADGTETLTNFEAIKFDDQTLTLTTPNVLLESSSSHDVRDWLMSNGTVGTNLDLGALPSGWKIIGSGDFNGDGIGDLILENTGTGELRDWLMSNAGIASNIVLGTIPAGWTLAGVGDFNDDGISDLLWRSTSANDIRIWTMLNGGLNSNIQVANPPSDWTVQGIGDFNGDGTSDIVWRNTTSGEVRIWNIINGGISGSVSLGNVPLSFTPAATGDFNNDGTTDLLWQDSSSGDVRDWLMANDAIASNLDIGVTSYHVLAEGRFNADGTDDLLWRNLSTGDLREWNMAGGVLGSQNLLGTLPTDWFGAVNPATKSGDPNPSSGSIAVPAEAALTASLTQRSLSGSQIFAAQAA
ncbi:MAG TPA: FG-GAP-like repeat-containing protein [Rhizomicrobium sp.]|nr:FG-GAP-like repeat-containing protein [Rhizomicrobium sp.]